MKKFAIPVILILHLLCNFLYYYDFNSDKANSFGWSVFFNTSWCISLSLFCLISAIKNNFSKFDRLFLAVEFSFSIILGIAFIGNYYGLIDHTYGFCITIAGLALTTLLLTISL